MKKRIFSFFLVVCLIIAMCPTALAYSTVRNGSSGNDVKTLQTMLNTVRGAGLTVDGKFGAKTLAAVKDYQRSKGLTADGICGSKTWSALQTDYNNKTKKAQASTLSIGSGKYSPGTLTAGNSYSINGTISSNYNLTAVSVGVYTSNGTATSQVKTVSVSNTKSYNISKLDSYIKFGQLSGSTSGTVYYLNVTARDSSGTTKTLVNNKFTVKSKATTTTTKATTTKATTVSTSSSNKYSGLVASNLGKVNFIRQNDQSCKATAFAMAVNLLVGKNTYKTTSMTVRDEDGTPSTYLCADQSGKRFTASNGATYETTYFIDDNNNTIEKERQAIEAAVNAGLPIVAAVHRTNPAKTQKHYVVIVGKQGNDYIAVDPASGDTSKTMEKNTKTLSELGYELGRYNGSRYCYGYISFTRVS